MNKKINLEKLVDIVGGPMKLDELTDEIRNLMYHRSPEKVIITIEKNNDLKKYYSVIYITEEDFKKYR